MQLPLTFVAPDDHPIWQAFHVYYQKNPVTIEAALLSDLVNPKQPYIEFNVTHAKQILAQQESLQTIDMAEFGQGVVCRETIANDCYLMPINGHYFAAGYSNIHDDKIIHLQCYDDFFHHSKHVMLHQTGLFSLIQHAPNPQELENYFALNLQQAEEKFIAVENLFFDQTIVANFSYDGQKIKLPFPLVKTRTALAANTMLAYCYGDRFWQRQVQQNPHNYFRCFHATTHQVLSQKPVRRAFWFELDGKPIKPLLIDEADIGKDIFLTIGEREICLSGKKMLKLVEQYPFATMSKINDSI